MQPMTSLEMNMSLPPTKHSLAFILDAAEPCSTDPLPTPKPTTSDSTVRRSVRVRLPTKSSSSKRGQRQRVMTPEEKRRARQCSIEGCSNYTIDRGLCFRHGGGKTCSVEGCHTSAKARGLCWRHGGSILCTVPGCKRGAKSRGLCWSHGGGTKCSVDGCTKTTISKGLCWTHGGGKRCSVDGCKRPASESKHNMCTKHHALAFRSQALPRGRTVPY